MNMDAAETFTPRGQHGRAFAVHSQDLVRVRHMSVSAILADDSIHKKCLSCYRWFTNAKAHAEYHRQRDNQRRKPRLS